MVPRRVDRPACVEHDDLEAIARELLDEAARQTPTACAEVNRDKAHTEAASGRGDGATMRGGPGQQGFGAGTPGHLALEIAVVQPVIGEIEAGADGAGPIGFDHAQI
jgi:hypothetical protein